MTRCVPAKFITVIIINGEYDSRRERPAVCVCVLALYLCVSVSLSSVCYCRQHGIVLVYVSCCGTGSDTKEESLHQVH